MNSHWIRSFVPTIAASLALVACTANPPAPFVPAPEDSVKPGINDSFLSEELDVENYVERFEGESREVFAQRQAIVDAIGLSPGMVVADIGAGTGPFLDPFARAVGTDGKVYAVDVAPDFVAHLAQRALDEGHAQVEARLCKENSVELPRGSIDAAFMCDVYHHFEFPRSTMGSLHYALREGGEVVIVDFERIEGVSREWTLDHVRAGKDEVIAELESFGFDLVEELDIEGLEENWVGRFREAMSGAGRRRLGALSLGALVSANMIGAGVFTTSGFALADLGSPDRVMLAWALGGVVAVLGALCYGALAARIAESGGEYIFLSRTLHPSLGFLAGWVSIWAGFTGAIAFAAEATQAYVAPWIADGIPLDLVGTAVIVLTGLLHTSGVQRGARVQNVVVLVKIAMLLGLIAVGASHLTPQPPVEPEAFSLGAFAATMMWVSLSYSGWNAAVYVAGEARDPKRTLPRSMLIAAVVVSALYLALNWIFVHAAPMQELAGKEDIAAVAAAALGGDALEAFVRAVLAVALVTSISSLVMIGPRVIAKMAEDGFLPRRLAFTGDAPAAAIWAQVAVAVAILWASGLREQLTNLGWILGLFTTLAVFGLLRLRRKEGASAVPVPGYPYVPIAFLLIVVVLTGTMVVVRGHQLVPATVVLVTGALVYVQRSRAHARAGR